MENNFITPAPNASKSIKNDEIIFSSYKNDTIISPLDGVVVDSIMNCRNNISIKHNFNSETIYSNFCNVGKEILLPNQKVGKGDKVGYFGDEKINYYITDRRGNKKNIKKIIEKLSSDKEEKKEKETIKQYHGSSDDLAHQYVKSIFKLPFTATKLIDKAFKKESENKKNNLIESEINRIKKLLK
jgi:hypothetical protein